MEIPHPEKKLHVDGEAQAVAVTKVLDDDNLLREIIVRVGFPTTLVRAALVCKRWLEHASDRQFLSWFRELHPPRLLGYYITKTGSLSPEEIAPRFVPMLPQPPELAAIIRLLESYRFGTHEIMQCHNSSIFTKCREGTTWTRGVHHPLCAQKGVQIITPIPPAQDHNRKRFSAIILKEEGSSFSYFYLSREESTEEPWDSMVRVYLLQDGLWHMRASATCPYGLRSFSEAVLGDNKIYMPAASVDSIIVFDLTDSSFYKIRLPQGVKYHSSKIMLFWANDASSIHLVHVKEFQLCIWLHKGDNWLLIDTICLHEMLSTLGIIDHTLENKSTANVQITQMGNSCQFVFLRICPWIFCLDIKCKTPCKLVKCISTEQMID